MEIGILWHDECCEPDTITAAEYLADGPANGWPAPCSIDDFLAVNEFCGEEDGEELMAALRETGRYRMGGGAGPGCDLIRLD